MFDRSENRENRLKFPVFAKLVFFGTIFAFLLMFIEKDFLFNLRVFLIVTIFLSLSLGYLLGVLSKKEDKFLEKLKKMATLDSLTQLLNRYEFNRCFIAEIERAERYHEDLSIAIIDIDFFKKINDRYGHAVGDAILKGFADNLKNSLRVIDSICRFGGEEFTILLPNTSIDKAKNVLERVRAAREKEKFLMNGEKIGITISIGLTQWRLNQDTLDKSLVRVDKLLYQAKKSGRNKVVIEE